MQPGAQHELPEAPWFWGNEHLVAFAPGVGVFREGLSYAHGGCTLQETLTPHLTVTAAAKAMTQMVRVESFRWTGLRLQVQLAECSPDLRLDLRTRAADASSTLLPVERARKAPDESGKATLLVEDDGLLGQAAVLVVVRDSQVICKQPVTIGEN